ncbi:hypothetical protein WOLCODRAFT_16574 [Wolfiporia cocos MD-104 SS10]|uniref:Uncharacterized protein n=1 Tax=Wolfiporia cocos (strain MD-104) TaxID=742152 RepID=A0A2H3JF53_WOLCO|nr:hypothetical protein WOLCODRAFT_16574 [Wolfiporia cocos MD-104 SS10]
MGPFATWEYIGKISQAIPTMRKVKDHVEADINHFWRGKSHTSPDKEEDVARLQSAFHCSWVWRYRPMRHLNDADKPSNIPKRGSNPGRLGKARDNWTSSRMGEHSVEQVWQDSGERATESSHQKTMPYYLQSVSMVLWIAPQHVLAKPPKPPTAAANQATSTLLQWASSSDFKTLWTSSQCFSAKTHFGTSIRTSSMCRGAVYLHPRMSADTMGLYSLPFFVVLKVVLSSHLIPRYVQPQLQQ